MNSQERKRGRAKEQHHGYCIGYYDDQSQRADVLYRETNTLLSLGNHLGGGGGLRTDYLIRSMPTTIMLDSFIRVSAFSHQSRLDATEFHRLWVVEKDR